MTLKSAWPALLLVALVGCAGANKAVKDVAAPAAALSGERVTATGSFVGLSDHITTGSAEVIWADGGWFVRLGPDFTFDGAPDPKVSFGGNGRWDPATNMGLLQANAGEQIYAVPADVDVGDYLEVYIWCEKFDVPLGVAALEL